MKERSESSAPPELLLGSDPAFPDSGRGRRGTLRRVMKCWRSAGPAPVGASIRCAQADGHVMEFRPPLGSGERGARQGRQCATCARVQRSRTLAHARWHRPAGCVAKAVARRAASGAVSCGSRFGNRLPSPMRKAMVVAQDIEELDDYPQRRRASARRVPDPTGSQSGRPHRPRRLQKAFPNTVARTVDRLKQQPRVLSSPTTGRSRLCMA